MKNLRRIVGLFCLVTAFNCSDSDAEVTNDSNEASNPNITEASLRIISIKDVENKGNSTDISINYSLDRVDVSTIKELRLFFSRNADLSIEELLQVPTSNYNITEASSAISKTLDENITDISGNPIAENQEYWTYLIGIYKDENSTPLVSDSKLINLKNEILVTTPILSGEFRAGEDIAIASDGTLYINEGLQGTRLFKVTTNGKSSVLSTGLNNPVGIALDDNGNIYSSNFNSHVINKTTPTGETSDYINDNRLFGGGGLAFDTDGNLYNTFYATSNIYKVNANSLEVVTNSTLFRGPVGVAYDKEREKLFVSSFDSGKIFHISEDGTVNEIADTDLTIGHLAYANDHFYITGWNEHKVYKVDLDGTIVARIGSGNNQQKDGTAQDASFAQPNGIEATQDGSYVYVTQQGNGKLRKIIMKREN